MSDVECPYCGKEQEINHDDGYGYEEGKKHEQECPCCEKKFTYMTNISFWYQADVADCLNGFPHEYTPTHTYPKWRTKMKCLHCDEERWPTDDEKIKYDIPDVPGEYKT